MKFIRVEMSEESRDRLIVLLPMLVRELTDPSDVRLVVSFATVLELAPTADETCEPPAVST